MSQRRVVVTGMGLVTPLGLTTASTWENLLIGKSGVSRVERFDVSDFPVKIAAQIKNFDPLPYMSAKEARKNSMFIQYALAAATQAFDDAKLVVTPTLAPRIGVAIGSGIGGLDWIELGWETFRTAGPRRMSPFFIPGSIINMASGLVSIRYGLKGPNIALVSACTTGTHCIGHAARMIKYSDADVMLAGGAEMATTPLGLNGFAAARALSTRNDEPEKACRPFDQDRDGFVMGEGSGVLVLEELEYARQRGARIYAEVVGFGMSADAFHITMPDQTGLGFVTAMHNTLQDAGLNPEEVDYINAHGTSTQVNDALETSAIKQVFKEHAYKLAVSSTKSMTGHLLGAAGAIEAIFSILTIDQQIIPPTINLDHPDVGCDLDFVPYVARKKKVDVVMSNSFGFGGTNGCLAFKRLSE